MAIRLRGRCLRQLGSGGGGTFVHFRLSLLRNSLGVDVSPTQESIVQLAEFIQAEVEVVVASKPEEKGRK